MVGPYLGQDLVGVTLFLSKVADCIDWAERLDWSRAERQHLGVKIVKDQRLVNVYLVEQQSE